MPAPSWILLTWAGFAATFAAALTGALVGGSRPATWSLLPRHHSVLRSLGGTAFVGLIAYPLIYGLLFETIGAADARLGALLGAIHALATLPFTLRARSRWTALRIALMHLLYGTAIAFLYVTP
jgi:hypothetical protein